MSEPNGTFWSLIVFLIVMFIILVMTRLIVAFMGAMCCCHKETQRGLGNMVQTAILILGGIYGFMWIAGIPLSSINWKSYTLLLDDFINKRLWGGSYILGFIGDNCASVARFLWISLGLLCVMAILRVVYLIVREMWCCGDCCAETMVTTLLSVAAVLVAVWYIGPVTVAKYVVGAKS